MAARPIAFTLSAIVPSYCMSPSRRLRRHTSCPGQLFQLYVSPDVCRSRSRIVISRVAGIVYGAPAFAGFASTFGFLNSGRYFEIGSQAGICPSSYSIITATVVIGFVIEQIRNIASAASASRPRDQAALRLHTTPPSRAGPPWSPHRQSGGP